MKQELKELPVNQIKVRSNYRKTFDEQSLKDLAASIRENGVLEPIIVRPNGNGYEIVAGERRHRASEMAGLVTIPAVIREVTDLEFGKLQLIENIQREDVPYMEEAYGIRKLRDDHDLDVSEICRMVGKSDAWVYNTLKLTEMCEYARFVCEKGYIVRSVAELVSRLEEEDQRIAADALKRKAKEKRIGLRFARKFIQEQIKGEKTVHAPRSPQIARSVGHDFCSNWKHYLVRFDCKDFMAFKKIVRERTETPVLAEAVEAVMLEKRSSA